MKVSGDRGSSTFYLRPVNVSTKPFGIIELFGDPPQNDYAFYESRIRQEQRETIIRYKTFKIRFKNQVAKWKYYTEGDTSLDPVRTIINPFSKNVIHLDNHLPNPKPENLKVALKGEADNSEIEEFYADIFLYDITI